MNKSAEMYFEVLGTEGSGENLRVTLDICQDSELLESYRLTPSQALLLASDLIEAARMHLCKPDELSNGIKAFRLSKADN